METKDASTPHVAAPASAPEARTGAHAPKGWGVHPASAAPFIWKWPLAKVKTVLFGLFDASFTSWGMDLDNRYPDGPRRAHIPH